MVAPALIGALVGAGYGALTYEDQKRQADEMRKANATIESTSPWTGVHGKVVGGPSFLGNVAGGALTGASFGMNDAFKKKGPAETVGDAGGAATAGQTVTQAPGQASGWAQMSGSTADGNMVEQGAQRGAVAPYADFSQPNSPGYSPWAYMTPGGGNQSQFAAPTVPGYRPPYYGPQR